MSAEVDQNAPGIGNKQVGRRSIAKGVAWSVPVLAVGAAVPAFAASPQNQDVLVTSTCGGIFGDPHFTIKAVGAPIGVGSTFTLTSTAIANVSLTAGAGLSVGVLSGGTRTITVTTAIPAGASRRVNVTGALSVFVLATFTLAVNSIVTNANTNTGNDQASLSLTGFDLGVAVVLLCGAEAAAEAAKKKAAEDAKKGSVASPSSSATSSATSSSSTSSAPSTPQTTPVPSITTPASKAP